MSGRKRRERALAEVAARPFWQASACPSWCVSGPHAAATPPEDRLHESERLDVILSGLPSLEHAPGEWQPQRLTVQLRQAYREAEPAVVLATDQRPDMPLTVWEATALAAALDTLLAVETGEQAGRKGGKKRQH